MKRRITLGVLIAFILSVLVGLPASGAGVSKSEVQAKTLSLSDMPTGWSVDNAGSNASDLKGCLSGLIALEKPSKTVAVVHVQYDDQNLPGFSEYVSAGKTANESSLLYGKYIKVLNGCKTFSFTVQGQKATGNVGQMSFPTIGSASGAYEVNLTVAGQSASADVVIVRAGQYVANVVYSDYSPDPSTAQAFATEAADKIEGKTVGAPTGTT